MENLRGEMFSPAKTLAPWSVTKYEYSIYCTNQIIAKRDQKVYIRLEAIAIRLMAIASRLEAIASRPPAAESCVMNIVSFFLPH